MASSDLMIVPAARWSDFLALDEDDLRELIDGELVEVEVPTASHEWVVSRLIVALSVWTDAHGGIVFGSGYKIRVRDDRGVMPDVQLFRAGHEGIIGDQGLEHGAPDLVVEVVSPSSRRYDRVVKLGWYASVGVAEYWLIDPEDRTLERLVLEGGVYQIATALEGSAVFAPGSFPGLEVQLASLWSLPGSR